jgi:hypothetical protein
MQRVSSQPAMLDPLAMPAAYMAGQKALCGACAAACAAFRQHHSTIAAWRSAGAAQQTSAFHAAPAASGKPKVAVASQTPPGWRWGANTKANAQAYNNERKQYREQVAQLRNAWQPLVDDHFKKARLCLVLVLEHSMH